MVRTRVRTFVAVLGVLIAFAMTPRTAHALTLDDYSSPPLVVFNSGSAPSLSTPDDLLSGVALSNNVYPDTSLVNIDGGDSLYFNYTERGSSSIIGSGSGYTFDNTSEIHRTYDYLLGSYKQGITSGASAYFDFYFVSGDWSTFPVGFGYQVCTPSYVSSVVRQVRLDSGSSPSDYYNVLPMSRFVVDDVMYYRRTMMNGQIREDWVSVPAQMRYPYYATPTGGVLELQGFLIRGHVVLPSFTALGSYDSMYFGLDGLKLRTVIPDTEFSQVVNGNTSQTSHGTPLSDTVTQNTENQTETLMDTTGSGDIFDGLTGGGYDGFVSRFGFIAQSINYCHALYDAILNSNISAIVTFPGVSVLGYQLVPATTVNVNDGAYGLRVLRDVIRPLLTGIAAVTWVFWVYHDFRKQFLEVSEVEE